MFPLYLLAQPLGNEWINYNQQYYKFSLFQNGVYKINYTTLLNSGFPINSVDPRSIQIFGRGNEEYIYIKGQSDGVFNTDDFIEFYGKKNDGWFDSYIYLNPADQPNPNYSMFNDTSTYYITWNASINNRRLQLETDENFSSYAPATYFMKVSREDYVGTYFSGEPKLYNLVPLPEYTTGKGWFDGGFYMRSGLTVPNILPVTKNISTTNAYASGPNAEIKFLLIGASNYAPVVPDHHARIVFAGITIDTIYEGYTQKLMTRSIASSVLGSSTSFTFTPINDQNSDVDINTIAYIDIKYPHSLNLENSTTYSLIVPNALQPKAYYTFSNLIIATNDTARIYDITNHKRIKIVRSGSNFKTLIPNGSGEKECFITSDEQLMNVNLILPVTTNPSSYAKFTNYNLPTYSNTDYLIVSHKSLWNEAEEYKNYRKSNPPFYNVLLADVDELYDQFSYGIRKNPLAIRNFCRFAISNFNAPPKYLFLIGKSFKAGVSSSTLTCYRKNPIYYNGTLVPTYGDPPSDNLLTSGINDVLFKPDIPTGRLSASTPQQVSIYLNKVMQYEFAQKNPELWMKNILHFGGGADAHEQGILAAYLNNFKRIVEDTLYGGYVRTFLKTSSAPIQINQSDSLKNIINNGVSLMTFFGHAAGIGFDQSIDDPAEYNNYGKYPFLLANSCFAGDIFSVGAISSEVFILIENKGAIGYLGTISLSGPFELNTYSNELYKNITYKNYGKPIGLCIQQTINNLQNSYPSHDYIKHVCYGMTLHGDPAIIPNSQTNPDYEITASDVYYSPTTVTSAVDSFIVYFVSTNIGKAIDDSFKVELVRTYPEGIIQDKYVKNIIATKYKDTISFKLPIDIAKGIGLNHLKITLDSYNEILELNENNNTTTVDLLIQSADIVPVYPYNYAIVPSQGITLKASIGIFTTQTANYIFEIDTTDTFNSPFKISEVVTQVGGGVVKYTPPLFMQDSTVYYWRVTLQPTNGVYNWRESSFQYINGKGGWSQAHFFQFKNDKYKYVTFNRPLRKFEFVNNFKSINIQTGYYPYIAWAEEWYKINNVIENQWSCTSDDGNGIKFAIINPVSGEPWISRVADVVNSIGIYGNHHCASYDVPAFDYYTATPPPNQYHPPSVLLPDTVWFNRISALIEGVPDGYYVLAFSHRSINAQHFNERLKLAFESIGSAYIRGVPNNIPYIIFGIKGANIGDANEVIAPSPTSIISHKDSIKTKWNEGYIESEIIGPSVKWKSIHWRISSSEIAFRWNKSSNVINSTKSKQFRNSISKDSVRLSVIGIKLSGEIDTLISNLPPDSADIYNLEGRINANTYPYMKLIVKMRDDSLHTPAQMKRWQVIFDGVPETALDPSIHYTFYNDTLQEGELLSFSTAIHNISEFNMDSLLVNYWIVDKNRLVHSIPYPRQRKHPAGDILIDTITASTKGISGNNNLWIEVNPNNDQLEQYHFNNIGEIPFFVASDKTNPMLDVTFDGVHIMNNDIVSAKPLIQISLSDENKYLPLNDTSSFKVFIQDPNAITPHRIYFSNHGVEIMKFIPASLPKNSCKIEYNGTFPMDGIYQLIVQAKDVTNNKSGDIDYKISFEVINKSTITDVVNWPNPFSTSTRFVFVLTGSEMPSYFKIQIMTITGKIVKEILQDEIGPIHIGRNITDYAWDGKDEFGDILANGVYLYRVVTNINGNSIEKKNTNASKYFTKEFGKMYIIR